MGQVLPGWFVFGWGWGTPNGFLMSWKGKVSWCQPSEFRDERGLRWAIRRRLELAGLEALEIQREPSEPNEGWERVKVLVKRLKYCAQNGIGVKAQPTAEAQAAGTPTLSKL